MLIPTHIPGKFFHLSLKSTLLYISEPRNGREEFLVLLGDNCCASRLAKLGDIPPDLHLAMIIIKSTPVLLPAFLF